MILNTAAYVKERILVDLTDEVNRVLYFIRSRIESNARFNIQTTLYTFEAPFKKDVISRVIMILKDSGYKISHHKTADNVFLIVKINL